MIITEEQLAEVKRLLKAKNSKEEGKKLTKGARKHIQTMINVKSADDLITEGLCKAGADYNSSSLFNAVQYSNHKKITAKGSQLNWFAYKKYLDQVWTQFSKDDKKPWATAATIIKKMDKPADTKSTKLRSQVVRKSIFCPICCYSTDKNFVTHLTGAHFPDYQTDANQKQLREDLEITIAQNPKLVDEWNNEFKAFWDRLFDNDDISLDSDYAQCKQFIDEAKSETGDSVVYIQVQDTSAQFDCNKDLFTQIHHYAGKSLRQAFRYFNLNDINKGRIGYEFKAAIESRIPIYFFIAFENLSQESSEIFEHCMLLALFHLDYKLKNAGGLSNVWNVNMPSLPKNHELCTADPKTLVKIGFMLLQEVLHKFKASVQDKSFFESKELLAHYNNLNEADQRRFINQCGTFEPQDDDDNKRSGKRRKINETGSGDVVQSEMTPQMAQYLI
ncbi:hypothetical protein M3Y97_00843600 [Aphelenchoides bicaudatus]|nr:hypothetical protein M3Y97_00843600 [Aphelenchoides bicaudatus]